MLAYVGGSGFDAGSGCPLTLDRCDRPHLEKIETRPDTQHPHALAEEVYRLSVGIESPATAIVSHKNELSSFPQQKPCLGMRSAKWHLILPQALARA